MPKPPLPPNFPGDALRFNVPNADQMKDAMKRTEKMLQEAMERLQDNPEAQEQMERRWRNTARRWSKG